MFTLAGDRLELFGLVISHAEDFAQQRRAAAAAARPATQRFIYQLNEQAYTELARQTNDKRLRVPGASYYRLL